MTLKLNLSDQNIQLLRDALGNDLDRLALEALVVEGYRSGRLSTWQVGQLVGIPNRWDIEKWLADRKVPLNYSTQDLEKDTETLDRVLGKTA